MKRLLMAAGVLLIVAASSRAQEQGDVVRVMSFNIRYDTPADGVNAWPHRKDWVAEIIDREADLAGMQEVVKHQLDGLKGRLPEFEFYGAGRDDGKEAGEFVPIAWRKERFTAAEKGVFWLSETPDVAGSKGWDAALPRVSTWARLKDSATGKTFLFVNTHFDHRGEQARRESAKLLRRWIEENAKGDPVVLTGDFNTTPKSVAYRNLAEGEGVALRDARLAVEKPEGSESTWNGFTAIVPGRRIDFVFTSGAAGATGFRTIDEMREGRFPSDHCPVVATVKIGTKGD